MWGLYTVVGNLASHVLSSHRALDSASQHAGWSYGAQELCRLVCKRLMQLRIEGNAKAHIAGRMYCIKPPCKRAYDLTLQHSHCLSVAIDVRQ